MSQLSDLPFVSLILTTHFLFFRFMQGDDEYGIENSELGEYEDYDEDEEDEEEDEDEEGEEGEEGDGEKIKKKGRPVRMGSELWR